MSPLLTQILIFLGMTATTIGAIATAFITFKRAKDDKSMEKDQNTRTLVDMQEKRIKLLETDSKDKDDRIMHLTGIVAQLQGEKTQLQDRVRTLETVSLDRNPQIVQFMQFMMTSVPQIAEVAAMAKEHIPFVDKALNKLLDDQGLKV